MLLLFMQLMQLIVYVDEILFKSFFSFKHLFQLLLL